METQQSDAPVSKAARWISYILSAIPVFMLLMSATMKISQAQPVVESFGQMGFPLWQAVPIGLVELVCTVLYLIPRTSVLGAILLTGYLGGATVTHVRAEEMAFLGAVSFGVMLWGGLFLRDRRIRALIPLRTPIAKAPAVD